MISLIFLVRILGMRKTKMIKLIFQFLKIFSFFCNLWKEKDELLAHKKADIAKEIVDAFKETDKDRQVSRLNMAIFNINRVHK